ncbi:YciI family protein [Corallococcus sp. bb12-1]|uniref:YciI family protein n=1 Tax=Corallococcus sp. bb12-1 TaxID=2996784 RepID=UPI00226ECFD5|nr:YciI family protein [Corallococcus sp. bb12-1]MCY1045098.1 YciI family protein [Corallococcus sp. bb12-1]
MSFMVLIQQSGARPSTEGERRVAAERMERMRRYGADLQTRGLLLASDSLRSDEEGVRIQVREGKRSFSDGPFTESKEIVGGFFLIDVHTRDEALAIANECPAVEWSIVEVRQSGPCFDE